MLCGLLGSVHMTLLTNQNALSSIMVMQTTVIKQFTQMHHRPTWYSTESSVYSSQQHWKNHHCKDLGFLSVGLRIKSLLNTKEGIWTVKATCRWLIECRLTIAIEYKPTLMTNCYFVLVHSWNLHPHLYPTLLRTLRTNELTRLQSNTTL